MKVSLVVLASLLGVVFGMVGIVHPDNWDAAIPNEYLVIFQDALDADLRADHMKYVSSLSADLSVLREFEIDTFSGYAVRVTGDFDLTSLSDRSEVKYIEANGRAFIAKNEFANMTVGAEACIKQSNVPSWGLTRTTEHALLLDGTYKFGDDSGSGVTAYVIDTGIYIQHPKFQGRAVWGTNTVDNSNTDGNGHGTHCAGTVLSDTYGLARGAIAVAVKVLNAQGSGSFEGIIAGINWAVNDHKSRGTGRSVANMSLGGGKSQALNDAVAAAVRAGVLVVVAAGNDNQNACNYSPASEPLAVTVGATDQKDTRATFSNYGKCLDVFGPGVAITSTWKQTPGNNNPINTISGTSMAAPHIAGVAVKLWALNPTASMSSIISLLLNTTTNNLVKSAGTGSPNKLVFQACL